MEHALSTERLVLDPLSLDDAEFIFRLVNTPGWIKFIGERNVNNVENAIGYIRKIIDNPEVNYWVAKLKDSGTLIGIVTFIKKPYLPHHDIGFAFLPDYTQKGYAFEAVNVVLKYLTQHPAYTHILATTVRENTKSVQLLKKLGMYFEKEIQIEDKNLLLFSILAGE